MLHNYNLKSGYRAEALDSEGDLLYGNGKMLRCFLFSHASWAFHLRFQGKALTSYIMKG